ncbi:hypothetical protein TUN199_10376, partial [Pyrenophora tritici-repentis]
DVLGHQANQIQVAQGISRNTHIGNLKSEVGTRLPLKPESVLTSPFSNPSNQILEVVHYP